MTAYVMAAQVCALAVLRRVYQLQIMNVFANGADNSTFVKVNLQDGSSKSVSLRQLSLFDEAVHKELYIGLIHQILRQMPMVTACPSFSSPVLCGPGSPITKIRPSSTAVLGADMLPVKTLA